MRTTTLLVLALLLAACAPGPKPATPTPSAAAPTPRPTVAATPTPDVPSLRLAYGAPVTFATHDALANYGFSFGPADGQFGAIPTGGGRYTFYAAAGSASCTGTKNAVGTFAFAGTLAHVTGGNACARLFGPGDGPAGWLFDRDYAGGGQVVRFASGGQSGWLMAFHGEYQWQNPATADHKCQVSGGGGGSVPCYYASLGLALSTDNGASFRVVGQVLQPSQPLSAFAGKGTNMNVGYGSLVVADANGRHLDNPPADPASAYFYLFFADIWPGLPGACQAGYCPGVARAPYSAVVAAALSGNPQRVATVFHKYDGAAPDPWTQPATSSTPDLSGTAGRYAPLWTDEPGYPSSDVIYDRQLDAYLTAANTAAGLSLRASRDLIHWSAPLGSAYSEPGRSLFDATLLGDTGDPTIGGAAPRLYFSSFPAGDFPDWKNAIFESVPLAINQ